MKARYEIKYDNGKWYIYFTVVKLAKRKRVNGIYNSVEHAEAVARKIQEKINHPIYVYDTKNRLVKIIHEGV